ncbi:hypothetical protein ACJMK2_011650 [Sinanodonta woodiana]|uniref:Uncharacterized protein n=1 Tax=Sinanodonta woodiana TaxID=1069815 RepID=A0ABD3V5P5_SINWO
MLILLPKRLLIIAICSELIVYALGKASPKVSPILTDSKLAPSGLEKDIDDPTDTIIHDPRELGVVLKARLRRSSSVNIDDFGNDVDVVSEVGDVDPEFYTGQGDGDLNTDGKDFAFIEEDIDINSGYSPWGSWSSCSHTCGIGRKRRERKCTGQHHCSGGDVEETICELQKC